jgi:DNA-binding CsgD family transcriptional regulator
MSSGQDGRVVRVVVTGPNRLFDDLVVFGLVRRGLNAWSSAAPDAGDDADVALVHEHARSAQPGEPGNGLPQGRTPTVLLVLRNDRMTRRRAHSGGVTACVETSASLDELADTLSSVAHGETVRAAPASPPEQASLTAREIDVLLLMAAGHDNASIATNLDISPHTARTHVQRILTKFDVRNRFSAVSVARGQGLLRPGT